MSSVNPSHYLNCYAIFLRIPVPLVDDADDDDLPIESDDDADNKVLAAFGLSPYFVDFYQLEFENSYAYI